MRMLSSWRRAPQILKKTKTDLAGKFIMFYFLCHISMIWLLLFHQRAKQDQTDGNVEFLEQELSDIREEKADLEDQAKLAAEKLTELEKEFAAFRSRYSDTVPRVEFRRYVIL